MEMRSDRLKRNAAIAGYEVMIIDTGSCENGARPVRVRAAARRTFRPGM